MIRQLKPLGWPFFSNEHILIARSKELHYDVPYLHVVTLIIFTPLKSPFYSDLVSYTNLTHAFLHLTSEYLLYSKLCFRHRFYISEHNNQSRSSAVKELSIQVDERDYKQDKNKI
jgi:hypothetical protein